MHIALTGTMLFFFLRKWDKDRVLAYLPTMWYIAGCDLLYYVICGDYYLWRYIPDTFLNQLVTNNLYSLLVLPLLAYLYLLHYPTHGTRKTQIFYAGRSVGLAVLIEGILILSGRIELQRGYHFWMEPLFYTLMFSMLWIHYRRPFLTYGLSVCITLFLIWYFHVPIE